MQIEKFQTWLQEKYSDSNVKVHYIELKVGRKVKKIPVFEENPNSSIDLKALLKSYISAKTKDTEFSDLSLGVRFVLIQPFTQTKIYIWPQQFLHEKVIAKIDPILAQAYSNTMSDSLPSNIGIFTGTLLADNSKIQTNMSKEAFTVLTNNRVEEFLTKFSLTSKDIEFYK